MELFSNLISAITPNNSDVISEETNDTHETQTVSHPYQSLPPDAEDLDELPELQCFRDSDIEDVDINLESDDILGGCPNFLFLAASSGDLHWAKVGIERNLDLHETNNFGMTAMHMAVIRKNWNVVAFLVKHGSDVRLEVEDLPGSSIMEWCTVNKKLMYVVIVGTLTEIAPWFTDETIRLIAHMAYC